MIRRDLLRRLLGVASLSVCLLSACDSDPTLDTAWSDGRATFHWADDRQPVLLTLAFDGSRTFGRWLDSLHEARVLGRELAAAEHPAAGSIGVSVGRAPTWDPARPAAVHFTYFLNGSHFDSCAKLDETGATVWRPEDAEGHPDECRTVNAAPSSYPPEVRASLGPEALAGLDLERELIRWALAQQAINEGHELASRGMNGDANAFAVDEIGEADDVLGGRFFAPVALTPVPVVDLAGKPVTDDRGAPVLRPRWAFPQWNLAPALACDPTTPDLDRTDGRFCVELQPSVWVKSKTCRSDAQCGIDGQALYCDTETGQPDGICLPLPDLFAPVEVAALADDAARAWYTAQGLVTLVGADGLFDEQGAPRAPTYGPNGDRAADHPLLVPYHLLGFRTPGLSAAAHDQVLPALVARGYAYDASVKEGGLFRFQGRDVDDDAVVAAAPAKGYAVTADGSAAWWPVGPWTLDDPVSGARVIELAALRGRGGHADLGLEDHLAAHGIALEGRAAADVVATLSPGLQAHLTDPDRRAFGHAYPHDEIYAANGLSPTILGDDYRATLRYDLVSNRNVPWSATLRFGTNSNAQTGAYWDATMAFLHWVVGACTLPDGSRCVAQVAFASERDVVAYLHTLPH